MRFYFLLILITLTLAAHKVQAQQDMELHVNGTFLTGKNILKVKRDYRDPYLWVLADNNEIYRINSLTRDVVDFTSQFTAYNNYTFIDIAGISENMVFIATASENLISYINGSLKIIGAAEGIEGVINAIGVNGVYQYDAGSFFLRDKILVITTSEGIFRYDPFSQTFLINPTSGKKIAVNNGRLFESTYRNTIFHSTDCKCEPDVVDKYGIITLTDHTVYVTDVFLEENIFGRNIKTAFSTTGNAFNLSYESNFGSFGNYFWATEKGLFQKFWLWHIYEDGTYKQYLTNKQINKVTSILGLKNFGASEDYYDSPVKENILVGADDGLYFSNSQYKKGPNADYTFVHYPLLGSRRINDIYTNADSYRPSPPLNGGFDYLNICEDGIWVATSDGLYFLKADYRHFIAPNTQISAAWFDDSIGSDEMEICEGKTVKLSLFGVQDQNLSIQWYKNGQSIVGETTRTTNITEQGEYHAILYDPCSDVRLESNHLKRNTISTPTFTFNYPDKINLCAGASTTLATGSTNNNYFYRWYKNGALNGNETSEQNVTESGKYKMEISSCSGTWVSTKEVEVKFISTPKPNLIANKTNYCVGDVATLQTSFVNDGTFTIDWYRDGSLLIAERNKTKINITQGGSYTVALSSNLVPCSNTSVAYNLNFELKPTIKIERITNTTLCDGQTVDVKATYSSGAIKWSTGDATDLITVNRSGTYWATLTTIAGCEVSERINILFFANPILNVSDATLCQFIGETVTLNAPAGFAKYEWNGKIGGQDFSTNKLGTVSLKVTDNNGCTATQTIKVTSQCDEIHVPNAFTPNNDGYNDTWNIVGIEDNTSIAIRVFNRSGEMVFRSAGYKTPWDGTFNGKKLPSGTYFYIIDAKTTGQTLSGSVTVIY